MPTMRNSENSVALIAPVNPPTIPFIPLTFTVIPLKITPVQPHVGAIRESPLLPFS